MERQKPVNSVQHDDDYSKALIESYGQWMGGNGFQQSDPLTEDGIPAEQKQGGGSFSTFTTAIGTVPGPENDESKEIPIIPELGVKDETAPNDVKKGAAAPDPAVDLRIGAGVKQSHGATIRDVTMVAKEEVEVEPVAEEGNHCCKKSVSYTHLTLPTKA